MEYVTNAHPVRDAKPPVILRKAEPTPAAPKPAEPEKTVFDVISAASAAQRAENPVARLPDRPAPRMADVRRVAAENNFDRPTEPDIMDVLRACREQPT